MKCIENSPKIVDKIIFIFPYTEEIKHPDKVGEGIIRKLSMLSVGCLQRK